MTKHGEKHLPDIPDAAASVSTSSDNINYGGGCDNGDGNDDHDGGRIRMSSSDIVRYVTRPFSSPSSTERLGLVVPEMLPPQDPVDLRAASAAPAASLAGIGSKDKKKIPEDSDKEKKMMMRDRGVFFTAAASAGRPGHGAHFRTEHERACAPATDDDASEPPPLPLRHSPLFLSPRDIDIAATERDNAPPQGAARHSAAVGDATAAAAGDNAGAATAIGTSGRLVVEHGFDNDNDDDRDSASPIVVSAVRVPSAREVHWDGGGDDGGNGHETRAAVGEGRRNEDEVVIATPILADDSHDDGKKDRSISRAKCAIVALVLIVAGLGVSLGLILREGGIGDRGLDPAAELQRSQSGSNVGSSDGNNNGNGRERNVTNFPTVASGLSPSTSTLLPPTPETMRPSPSQQSSPTPSSQDRALPTSVPTPEPADDAPSSSLSNPTTIESTGDVTSVEPTTANPSEAPASFAPTWIPTRGPTPAPISNTTNPTTNTTTTTNSTTTNATATTLPNATSTHGQKSSSILLAPNLLMQCEVVNVVINDTTAAKALSVNITYDAIGWVAIAISRDGRMVGSEAIIGLPGDGDNIPKKYVLDERRIKGVRLVDGAKQTLLPSSRIGQFTRRQTYMSFIKFLREEGEIEIITNGTNTLLWAVGFDNALGYHAARDSFELFLPPSRPALCSLPRISGRCRGKFISWYYDETVDECVRFTYGGCGGNDNRFADVYTCNETCRLFR